MLTTQETWSTSPRRFRCSIASESLVIILVEFVHFILHIYSCVSILGNGFCCGVVFFSLVAFQSTLGHAYNSSSARSFQAFAGQVTLFMCLLRVLLPADACVAPLARLLVLMGRFVWWQGMSLSGVRQASMATRAGEIDAGAGESGDSEERRSLLAAAALRRFGGDGEAALGATG